MKRAKFVRIRKIYIFNVLLLVSIFLFHETRTDFFVKELSKWQLGKLFPEGTVVEIGNVEGGIFSNLVSEDVRISPPEEIWQNTPTFDIKRVEINYRLWYPLFGKMPTLLDGERVHLHIAQGKGAIDGEIERKKGEFIINGKINHLKLDGVDFIGEYTATVNSKDRNFINIRIAFKNMIINYTPFSKNVEIFTSYDKTKEALVITKFKIGDEIEGQGYASLTNPYNVFLKWTVTDLNLEDYFIAESGKESVSGRMNGNFTLKGPLREARLLAHMDVQDGNFGGFTFDSAMGDLKGKGPLISISDSRIRKENDYMILSGEADLTKLKDKKAFDGVFLKMDENVYSGTDEALLTNGAIQREKF